MHNSFFFLRTTSARGDCKASRLTEYGPSQRVSERCMEEQPQQIRIVLDDHVAQGEYVNFANIIHSPSEFVIDLGRIVPGRTDVKIFSRIIVSPLHAKQLLEALAQNISLFEQKYGEIRVDAVQGFTSNEPSN